MDNPESKAHAPKVFSDEEIDMFLDGDRRAVDRHILYSLNRIAAVLVPHVEREADINERLEAIGGLSAIEQRARYVDSLIKKNEKVAAMAEKVAQSVVVLAVITFLGFLVTAVWNEAISAIRAALKLRS